MADFDIKSSPNIEIKIMAHIGNIGTVSLGKKNRRDSLLLYSPPRLAVPSINPTEDNPNIECTASTLPPLRLRIITPIASPNAVMDRRILFASKGLLSSPPDEALMPVMIAMGVARRPKNSAQ